MSKFLLSFLQLEQLLFEVGADLPVRSCRFEMIDASRDLDDSEAHQLQIVSRADGLFELRHVGSESGRPKELVIGVEWVAGKGATRAQKILVPFLLQHVIEFVLDGKQAISLHGARGEETQTLNWFLRQVNLQVDYAEFVRPFKKSLPFGLSEPDWALVGDARRAIASFFQDFDDRGRAVSKSNVAAPKNNQTFNRRNRTPTHHIGRR